MTTASDLTYAQSRLTLARWQQDTAEVNKWAEHVKDLLAQLQGEDIAELESAERIRSAAPDLLAALEAAAERMEAVAAGIPVHNRSQGVSQATHVAHMAAHLAQHAKIARAAIAKAKGL